MRTMYDAVTAANIPASATMVAGYGDTIRIPQWTDKDWARFPNATKVVIVKKATTNAGHVLDVELGDATPAQAPGWVQLRRAAGLATPTVYMNSSTWPAVKAAFAAAKVTAPLYWVADYDGDPTIPAGAIAKQFKNTAAWDESSVADYWPGVDPAPSPSPITQTGVKDDNMVTGFVTADDELIIPCNMLPNFFLAASTHRTVNVTEMYAVGDTPVGAVSTAARVQSLGAHTFNSDRPGPVALPSWTRHVVIRFNADHAFATWCA